MKQTGECPKCGSRNVSCKDLFLHGFHGPVDVSRKTTSLFSESSPLDIFVCGECGFLEMYAREPSQLVSKPKSSE